MSDLPTQVETTPLLLTRRTFVYSGIAALSGFALAGCMGGIMARGDIEITHRTLPVPYLPESFKGLTATLISDIHSSPFMSLDDMKNIVRLVNGLKSDLIFMPGDFVTSHRNEIQPFVEAMAELRAPLGIFGCTGNHDFYTGIDSVCKAIDEIDIKLLRNENVALTRGNDKLYLIGVDDSDSSSIVVHLEGKDAYHITAAYRGIPEKSATILLCHKPYHFDEFSQLNTGLMLSGHTHGGQIVLGRIGKTPLSLCTIASHYVEGLYEAPNPQSKSKMYVSRGIGVVGLPLRINCPPEITKITLV